MQIYEVGSLTEICTNPMSDVINRQGADTLDTSDLFSDGSMKVIECRCPFKLVLNFLKPSFNQFEQCPWNSPLMRMALPPGQNTERRLLNRLGRTALDLEEPHFSPRV